MVETTTRTPRRVKTVLTAAVLAGSIAFAGCGSTVSTTSVVTSGDCAHERTLVRRALDRSTLRVDVNGDRRLDTVAVVTDPRAGKRCRAFVGVRLHGGSAYSTPLYAGAVPVNGFRARVVGLPELGDASRAQIVVDTRAAVDGVLAQLFAFSGGALRRLHVPAFEDGTFLVEGGGLIYPHGASCTSRGRLVLSQASQSKDGKRYRVVRHTYDVRAGGTRFTNAVITKATVPVDQLVARFPEFAQPHWSACNGSVRH
jgi:hypothetical protein